MNKLTKGFTLIELLVVIAILGILAAVVLIAINPAERINEANDSGAKSAVGQVATALEACYTANSGSYTNCVDATFDQANLVSAKYMKAAATATHTIVVKAVTNSKVWVQLDATSNKPAGCAAGKLWYWVYDGSNGTSGKVCDTPTDPT